MTGVQTCALPIWKVSYVCKNSDRCRQKIAKNLPTGFRYFFYDGKQFTFGNFFSQEIPNCFDSVAVNTQINNLKKQFLDVEIEIWNWISKDMNAKKYLDYNFQGRVF